MTCLLKTERPCEALKPLTDIHTYGAHDNSFPEFITMVASINTCSKLASLRLGQMIHGYTTRAGFISDVFVQNSFIDMNGKSGRLDLAEQMFEEMPVAAYGMNGNGISALQTFTKLKKSGIHKPNEVTFASVLSACSHSGFIEEQVRETRGSRSFHREDASESGP
ncbi:hypothetical protein Vadar_022422 [Vaccinium darrowii]|uniref:Uncharacterized protein n=1 Tax=Vaccinium darrowii TaxID=229202 RepID=A0ACB7XJ73_9ERIC|nr:hypothetical protein Vadar_022422 [Vaccinium darrowii]